MGPTAVASIRRGPPGAGIRTGPTCASLRTPWLPRGSQGAPPPPDYRLLTTWLDPAEAPAVEWAALYHERWAIEQIFDEFKTHPRGPRVVLRSKTPDGVRQEAYGYLLTHYALRKRRSDAAEAAATDPDRLSFTHAVPGVRRTLTRPPAFSP